MGVSRRPIRFALSSSLALGAGCPIHLSMRYTCFGWVSVNYPGLIASRDID